jgi:hypothetical protein
VVEFLRRGGLQEELVVDERACGHLVILLTGLVSG